FRDQNVVSHTFVSGVTVSFAFGTESASLRCELSPTTSTRALPPSRIWPCLTRIRIVEARRSLAVFAEPVSLEAPGARLAGRAERMIHVPAFTVRVHVATLRPFDVRAASIVAPTLT